MIITEEIMMDRIKIIRLSLMMMVLI